MMEEPNDVNNNVLTLEELTVQLGVFQMQLNRLFIKIKDIQSDIAELQELFYKSSVAQRRDKPWPLKGNKNN